MSKQRDQLVKTIINFLLLFAVLAIPTYVIVRSFNTPLRHTNLLIRGDVVKYHFEAIEDAYEEFPEDKELTREPVELYTEEFDVVQVPEPEEPVIQNWWEYPETILPVTKSGDDLLVLVNKSYQLPSTYIPSNLTLVTDSGIRVTKTFYARDILIDDLRRLNDDIKKEGIDISVISAYRSFETQQSTYNYWVNYNGGDVAAADTISARPGHSQHQLGTALDFSTGIIGDRVGSEFDNTSTAIWLKDNAYKYGFVIAYPKGYEETTGYNYESWHYRYIGVENAKQCEESGEVLEVWLTK